MKAYCISGIGANEQVFHNLKLNFQYVTIKWKETSYKETLKDYARKLCEQVDTSEAFVLIGVSFGGMLAIEMNNFINPKKTILISSAATRKELPVILKLIGKSKIINLIPSFLFTVPPFLLFWTFGIKDKQGRKMIREIVCGMDRKFTKISIEKILNWKNSNIPKNLVRIHGDKDMLLPAPSHTAYIKVKGGRHFMIGDRAEEISDLLNREIATLK